MGRGDTEDGAKSKMSVWYAMPCPVPGVGKYSLVYATHNTMQISFTLTLATYLRAIFFLKY